MSDFDVTLDASGPVFDGEARVIMAVFTERVVTELGEEAVNRIRNYLPTEYMYLGHNGGTPQFNPVPANAGYYESVIHTDRQTRDWTQVHDTPCVYGPWLEGVSSKNAVVWPHKRNPPARRFPGYAAFRKISQQLDIDASVIAEDILVTQGYLEAVN